MLTRRGYLERRWKQTGVLDRQDRLAGERLERSTTAWGNSPGVLRRMFRQADDPPLAHERHEEERTEADVAQALQDGRRGSIRFGRDVGHLDRGPASGSTPPAAVAESRRGRFRSIDSTSASGSPCDVQVDELTGRLVQFEDGPAVGLDTREWQSARAWLYRRITKGRVARS